MPVIFLQLFIADNFRADAIMKFRQYAVTHPVGKSTTDVSAYAVVCIHILPSAVVFSLCNYISGYAEK